jgi:hypothetical protein
MAPFTGSCKTSIFNRSEIYFDHSAVRMRVTDQSAAVVVLYTDSLGKFEYRKPLLISKHQTISKLVKITSKGCLHDGVI